MSDKSSAFHAVIEGRVQGVAFRYFVQKTAVSLGIVGWVRNRFAGQVELLAEGDKEQLSKLITALHQGPPSSVVTNVNIEWKEVTGKFTSFSIRLTR